MSPSNFNRRNFLTTSAAVTGGLLLSGKSSFAGQSANDRVRIAVVGLNGRGRSHIDAWAAAKNVEVVYLVDPDADVLAKSMGRLDERTKGNSTAKAVADIRVALDDKSVDAISIAAPNHWHSLMTIWAAQAGKHVYVEKPMSHDVVEGRVVVAARKVRRRHSARDPAPQRCGNRRSARGAEIWQVATAEDRYGYCCKPRAGIGFKSPTAPPSNLNWDLWKGPAVLENYHANLVHYNWHWFWPTGNGDMNNQGTHQLDVARWAIDDDQTHPVRVMGMGGRFQWNDQGETPNTMFAMAEYPNGQQVFFNVRNVNHKGYERQVYNEYFLEDGSVITGESKYMIRRPGSKQAEPLELEPGKVTPGGNWNSFIAAVRAGDPNMANGNAKEAHYGSVLGHLMNNSYRLGETVPFDPQAVSFGDNADAAEHFAKLHDIMANKVGVSRDQANYVVGPMLEFDPASERHRGEMAEPANALLKNQNNKGFAVPRIDAV